MLITGYANLWHQFYPVGNTPAVCLTQGLPPGQKADLLLLGCGDVRNILFSVFSDGPRPMDFTCCDTESAILARNILLITLILDDSDDNSHNEHFDIYYHVFFNATCHGRLLRQAKKLHALAVSLSAWRASEYGKLIKFCDTGTLCRVAEVWALYVSATTETQSRVKETFRTAQDVRKEVNTNGSFALTAARSATPNGTAAIEDMIEIHERYWRNGTTYSDHAARLPAPHANPMFISPDHTATLHYGTDPMLGFHLLTAYLPFTPDSSLYREERRRTTLEDVLGASRAEFRAWCYAFREQAHNGITLRFFCGDAICFCHALQHRRVTSSTKTSGWYRSRHDTSDPLMFDDIDYGTNSTAPLSFHVVDTSSLIYHLGALNLLVAVSPLLKDDASSTLYTETLSPHDKGPHCELLDRLLGGHLPTISLLLGLFPVDYWTNASPSSVGDELLLRAVSTGTREVAGPHQRKLYTRITWKRPPGPSGSRLQRLHIAHDELASMLYRIYLGMFPAEDKTTTDSSSGCNSAGPQYTRSSFASLLCLVKSHVVTKWEQAMAKFINTIDSNHRHKSDACHLQELYLYMHTLGVFRYGPLMDFSKIRARTRVIEKAAPSVFDWQDMPLSVCVTLKVPRSALWPFTEPDPKTVGIVPVNATIFSDDDPGRLDVFSAVQLVFGKLSTSGARFSNDFELEIAEDAQGWNSSCPLFVSFRIPSRLIFTRPPSTWVGFNIQATPLTISLFQSKLAPGLNVFKARLRETTHVYLSKDLPNQKEVMSVPGFSEDSFTALDGRNSHAKTTLTLNTDPKTATVTGLTIRLDGVSEGLRSTLMDDHCPVAIIPVSPCVFVVAVGSTSTTVTFPVPVLASTLKTRIARPSSYIELRGSILAHPAEHPSATFTSPLYFPPRSHPTGPVPSPICRTIPHVYLPSLPTIALTDPRALEFLLIHTGQMFSTRESRVRSNMKLLYAAPDPIRARIGLKDSLHNIFLRFTGLAGSAPGYATTAAAAAEAAGASSSSPNRPTVFALSPHPDYSNIKFVRTTSTVNGRTIVGHTPDMSSARTQQAFRSPILLILPASLRLDLSSRTVLLDTAVLPLTEQAYDMLEEIGYIPFLAAQPPGKGVVNVKGVEAELDLWRAVVPSWVERCRAQTRVGGDGGWEHGAGCEYYGSRGGGENGASPRKGVNGGGGGGRGGREGQGGGEGGGGGEGWIMPEMGDAMVCSCGKGKFPDGWLPEGVPKVMWENGVKDLCVRAAILPLFASALAEDVVPDPDPAANDSKPDPPKKPLLPAELANLFLPRPATNGCRQGTSGAGDADGAEKGDGVSSCRVCGKEEGGKNGVKLMACGRCYGVKYCGRECQKTHWTCHKKECAVKKA